MAKQKGIGRSHRAKRAGNKLSKGAARKIGGTKQPPRKSAVNTARASKRLVAVTATRTRRKFIRVKSRKKIDAKPATATRGRRRSVFRRVKSALRRLGGTQHRVGTRKRAIRLIPPKARPRKATRIRLSRAHASMRFFSAGRAVRANVSRKTASVVGSYLTSVRKLLDTNDPGATDQFAGRSVKDVRGNVYPLETNPNTLYRLSASVEPFEEVYRLLA